MNGFHFWNSLFHQSFVQSPSIPTQKTNPGRMLRIRISPLPELDRLLPGVLSLYRSLFPAFLTLCKRLMGRFWSSHSLLLTCPRSDEPSLRNRTPLPGKRADCNRSSLFLFECFSIKISHAPQHHACESNRLVHAAAPALVRMCAVCG